MKEELQSHIDAVLQEFTSEHYRGHLVDAKEAYAQLTGAIRDDEEEYEARMNCFNDWYMSQFVPPGRQGTLINDYLARENVDSEVSQALLSIEHSLYSFHRARLSGRPYLRDILHRKKVILARDHGPIGLVAKDLFTGRIICYQGEHYLLGGLCLFPSTARNILTKQARKVRKQKSPARETEFLLHLEALKTKWLRYGKHVDATKIFTFSNHVKKENGDHPFADAK